MPQILIWGGRALLAYAGVSALGYGAGNQIGKAIKSAAPYAVGAGVIYMMAKKK